MLLVLIHLLGLLVGPSLPCLLLNRLLDASVAIVLVLRATTQLRRTTSTRVRPTLVRFELHLLHWPLLLFILLITVLAVDVLHGQGAL